MSENKIRLEPLGGGMEVFVSSNHSFGTDTVILAAFSLPKAGERACDLGTGCGTIPLIWCRNLSLSHIAAVDISTEASLLLNRSVAKNGLQDTITVLNCDLRHLNKVLAKSSYDIVVCNPPYKAAGAGLENPIYEQTVARHEAECSLDDIVSCAAALLRFGGRFCICQRPERLCDVMETMRRHSIEPKRLRLVQQRPNKAPKLFLLEGRRGGKKGGLVCEPVLMIEDGSGGFSEEMLQIYGSYKDGHL